MAPLQGETRTELLRKGASATHLNVVDSAKVKNIVEVCNVSAEEATRVLHACRMDETLAIERFLNGSENSSAWSEVSKKKKVPAPRTSSSAPRHGRGGYRHERNDRNQDRNHDRENERRSRGRDRYNDYNSGGRPSARGNDSHDSQRGGSHAKTRYDRHSSQAPSVTQARLVPKSKVTRQVPANNAEPPVVGEVSGITWNEPEVGKLGDAENVVWSMEPSVPAEHTSKPELPSSVTPAVSLPPDNNILPEHSPKHKINYAAAAKVGTTHEKRSMPTGVHSTNAPVSTTPNAAGATTKKHRSPMAPTAQEIVDSGPTPTFGAIAGNAIREEVSNRTVVDETVYRGDQVPKASQILNPTPDLAPDCTIPKPNPAEAWGDRSASKVSESSTPAAESAPTPSKEVEDSLVLQFGSFGLGDFNNMNWAPTAETSQIPGKKVDVSPVAAVPAPLPDAAARVATEAALPQEQNANNGAKLHAKLPTPVSTTPNVKDSSVPKQPLFSGATSMPLPTTSLPGGNFQHLMAMGVNASFGLPSFAPPYMIPPPMPYASGIGSFDHGNEANRNRGMNPPPAVPPMYEQGGLGVSSVANGAKYNAVPGLSETPGQMNPLTVPSVPKEMLPTGSEEGDRPVAQSGAPPMPGNVDALNTPFIMPQYPYLVPSYPSMQYGPPPGMAPPGPNHHYPFAAVGQVSNQGAYPGYHTPNTSMNKFANGGAGGRLFGYEDGSQLMNPNSRSGNGLNESMYSNGNYLNNGLPDTVTAKGLNEPNTLASGRIGVPTGVPTGVPPGVPTSNVGPPLNNPSMPHTSAPVSGGVGTVPSYSDYAAVGQGHNVVTLSNGANPTQGGWNNRQSGVARTDANLPNPQSMGTNVHHSAQAAPNTGMYGPPPTAAPGYWAGASYY